MHCQLIDIYPVWASLGFAKR